MLSMPTLKRRSPRLLPLGAAFAVLGLLAPAPVQATTSREIQRFDVRVKNSDWSAGAARARVLAKKDVLKAVVTDYAHYKTIITRFRQARVVGRVGDKTDVYLEVPILKGAAKVWAIVRFEPPALEGSDEVVRGKMIKGNVKRLDAVWRIRAVDASSAELDLELLIVPDLPAPRSLVLGEVRSAAARAVWGAREEAERRGR
jgi:ribosome-associated toxin RatA of RatAB toxin-antitoxin module